MINTKTINEILCILFFHTKLPILISVFHFETHCVCDITPPFLTSHVSSAQQPPVASGCPLRDHPLPTTEQPSHSPSTPSATLFPAALTKRLTLSDPFACFLFLKARPHFDQCLAHSRHS